MNRWWTGRQGQQRSTTGEGHQEDSSRLHTSDLGTTQTQYVSERRHRFTPRTEDSPVQQLQPEPTTSDTEATQKEREMKDIMGHSECLRKCKKQQMGREQQLHRKDGQLIEHTKQLKEEEDQQKGRVNQLWRQEDQIKEKRMKLKKEEEQLRRGDDQLSRDEEEIYEQKRQFEKNLDQPKRCENLPSDEQIKELKSKLEGMELSRERNKWKRQCKEKEEQLKEREIQLKREEAQMSEWKRQCKEKEDQLKEREIQIKTDKEQINQCIKNLKEEQDKLNGEKEQLKSENENQIRRKDELNEWEKRLNSREDQLNERNENLCKQQNDLKKSEERREIQLETINRQEDEIHAQKSLIELLTKMKEEREDKMKKDEERMKEQVLQMERNCETLNTQEEKLQTLKTEIQNMKKQTQRDKKGIEEALQEQKNVKQINEREIERQNSQIQEQKRMINTQKEEIDKLERDIQTNRDIIKETWSKKETIEKNIASAEKELQMKMKKFQEEVTELERLKKLYEQDVSLMRLEAEQNKYREIRRREEDLQTLQDFYDQLNNRLSSLSYKQDCDTEGVLSVELGKIFEKMKMKLQRSSEEIKKIKEQDSSRKAESDDTTHDVGSNDDKVFEESLSQMPFTENIQDPDSDLQDIRETTQRDNSERQLRETTLQSLGLENFYCNKQTIEYVFSIGSPKEKHSDSNMVNNYLQKLFMLNYRARFIMENDNKDSTLSARTGGHCDSKDGGMNDDDNDYRAECNTITVREESCERDHLDEFLSERAVSSNTNEKETIHPMDVQMAVFHCADGFLKQNMVTKLSSCQYALPLLVPSPTSTDIELPLWTFRQIKKTWKPVGGLSTSLPVCQVKAPMVFFCRLGSVSTSKSQLLNSVINPKHDTFFHRDSPGSSSNRLFMEGLVEIAWYCPAGNTDDLFSNITAFCNLHGDAVRHMDQTDFLFVGSTINVVLMQNMKLNDKGRELLEKLHKSSKPLICLVSDLQKGSLKVDPGLNVRIGLRGRNREDLHYELTHAIKMCLQKCNISTFNLEKSSKLAKHFGFSVDENSSYCQEGKTRAEEVMKLLEKEDISQIKNKFLPCQGKLWHEWTIKNKELHRLRGEMYSRDVTLKEMKEIRLKQRGINLGLMKSFVKSLTSCSKTQRQYFIQWIKCSIEHKVSDQLSQINLKYNSKWLEVQKLKNSQGKSEELKVMQKQLEEVSEELDTVTFGLEHIVREMGQIYEAWAERPDKITAEVSALPALAADLLISGHPLELMDGDAAHVPLTWIESVLDKVTETLGDQRVFVLSVLGLQSSGKSTMLNTMFGLQFAVSAGRCTRGAFMQLVRVKEEVKEELKFDYLLVVDTEGLQSSELAGKSMFNHDNELATFIICLANMTLINISGENPAEIEGILQIVIQAILRMKNDKLNPRCMFVHQNITDLTAAEKNIEGRRRLQEKLDEITFLVAKEEGCDAEYFTNVIKFNIETDVHYLAQLWEGNPPMAPPNPRYSENAEGLKQDVLTAAAQQKALTFSELKVRISDLWTAVLNEHFAFSFKSSLEIAAYRKKIGSKQ